MEIDNRFVNNNDTLLGALKIMDQTGFRSLIVINDLNKFNGILSIGDIQRSIIKNNNLNIKLSEILRRHPRVANLNTPYEKIKEEMIKYRMEFMPILNTNLEIEKIIYWEDLFKNKIEFPLKQFELPIIVMAGGKGTRLRPLTNVLPKPLIPIGEITIIEEIFNSFNAHGCRDFYISVNYKSEFIKNYLTGQNLPYRLNFFEEKKPMGTAGSLSLLRGLIDQTFFVSNCDILIDQDYSEMLDYHVNNKNEITIIAALKHFPIAYGTIESGENGRLLKLVEKPELTFKINSGMYILEPHLINEIPNNKFFHITELIENVKKRDGKIGVYPVSEKSWKDIGSWDEYGKEIQKFV